jgi:hypothetical protein
MLALQIGGLVLVFLGFVFKELSDKRKNLPSERPLRWLYWVSAGTGMLIGIGSTVWTQVKKSYDDRQAKALKLADEGRNIFHDGLTAGSTARIEMSFEKLDAAIQQLSSFPDLRWRYTAAAHDRALGYERVAYGDKQRGCLYFRDRDRIDSCWVNEGSKIFVNPPTYRYLRCTDVDRSDVWQESRSHYDVLQEALAGFENKRVESEHYADEIAAAARSSGYFRLCDHLRNMHGTVADVRRWWKLARSVAEKMATRRRDLDDKLRFLEVLESGTNDVSCARPCELDEEKHPIPASMVVDGGEYYELRFDDTTELPGSVEMQNLQHSSSAGLTIDTCSGSGCVGVVEAEINRPEGFRQAIASWDGSTPTGSIEIYLSAKVNGTWSKPLAIAEWSETAERTSRKSQAPGLRVFVDTLVVDSATGRADALRITARLRGSKAGGKGPVLRGLGISVSGPSAAQPTDLLVPEISQMLVKDGGAKMCSPTSLGMLLSYWSGKESEAWNQEIPAIAKGVFDADYSGYGNWSFNVAYANAMSDGKLRAFVTRLRTVEELGALVTSGIPVIVSLQWEADEMTGAAIRATDGHLLVVRGFDTKGDLIVNDPADPDGTHVRRTYDRTQFKRAWRRSQNTVYIIVPSESRARLLDVLTRLGVRKTWPG